MNNPFTEQVSDIIVYSKEEANRLGNDYIGTEHLLLGILRESESKAVELLSDLKLNLKELKTKIETKTKKEDPMEEAVSTDIIFNEDLTRVLKLCILEAKKAKSEKVETEHLLLAITKSNNTANDILNDFGITYDKVQKKLKKESVSPQEQPANNLDFTEDDEDEDDFPVNERRSMGTHTQQDQQEKKGNQTPILDNFSTDITKAAMNGLLDPVIGRDKEIERIVQILSRRKKNNPVILGEPGVGKSALVEGLAQRIVNHKVSRILFNKRVVSLNLGALVAGTKFRGQLEERLQGILRELEKNPDIIVYIDEIQNLVSAGASTGGMDGANILKPALARGGFQCIGATTLNEYRESIEKDGALERRFQKIIIEPTTSKETLEILRNIKDKYEEHHQVIYSPEALEACVNLSKRYITERFFPDKAIDVLDEAGSRTHTNNISVPKEIEEQEKLIEETKRQKNDAVKQQNFELAASFRDKEKGYTTQLAILKENWEKEQMEHRKEVTPEDIAQTVSLITGIPVHKMAQDEGYRLIHMKEEILKRIIGQDKAVETIVKAIRRNRIGLKDPNRPIGTFLFLGPTGVGKTHLAKQLAKQMFGSEDAIIRFDMSEYMEKYNTSRLIGAPPGYLGYNEGGQLTEKVRRKPYSIVLFDEIEKAHPDIFNLLLQVMDEGRLTDANGRRIDFRHTVIILTSNLGSRRLKEFSKGIGFSAGQQEKIEEHSREIITKSLNKSFAPEFINRLDEIINFEQLSLESILKIVDIELNTLSNRLKSLGYTLEISPEAREFIGKKGYDVQYGARPLKRSIQTYLEDPLAEHILSEEMSSKKKLMAVLNTEKDSIDIVSKE